MNKKKCGNCKALEEHLKLSGFSRCCIYGELQHINERKFMGIAIHEPLRHKDCTKQCRTIKECMDRVREKYES